MNEILSQLGINWRLLLSQGVNFFIVFGILTVFVWKPLLRIMQDRKSQIETGLENAKEIERRLKDIEREREENRKAAEKHALEIIASAEKRAETRFEAIIEVAEKKAKEALDQGINLLERKREEELTHLVAESHVLLREAIAKALMRAPENIDAELIQAAATHLKHEIRS
jgi:F-type H+-transporting ATPase subunit b